MNTIRVVGIDIAKSVFQVCVWMVDGSIAYNKKISRSKLLDCVRHFEPGTLIAMEACSTSHFWGRTFRTMGYNVRLIPAQHVKAFVRSQKNDANDALAICETALRPGIHFVPVKTAEQQDIKALRNTRQLMVEQRTALANQLRSLLAECKRPARTVSLNRPLIYKLDILLTYRRISVNAGPPRLAQCAPQCFFHRV